MRKILLLLTVFLFISRALYAGDLHQSFFLTTMDEEEIEGVIEHFPTLGERVRDWRVIAEENAKIVVHIIIQDSPAVARLKNRPEYLGESYKEIAQKAKAGDNTCLKVLKRIVFTNWEIDNPEYPEEGPEKINHRGSLGEWIDAGKPTKLSDWFPAHVWLGQGIEVPKESEVEGT